MSNHSYVKSYRDLVVYQKARELAVEVYVITQSFPREEMYSLTNHIQRSSRSIGAQIAEAWAKRRYPKHFLSKLTDADGELQETQHWIEIASDCGYLSLQQTKHLLNKCCEVVRMIGSMINKADKFSHPQVKNSAND